MADLTTAQAVPFIIKRTLFAKVAAGQKIFFGAKCGFKDGYLYNWGATDGLKHPCEAIREGRPSLDNAIDNTDGLDGDKTIAVDFIREKTLFFYDNDESAAVTQAQIGGDCYGVDNHTVTSAIGDPPLDRVGTPWIISDGSMGAHVGVYVEV